MNELKKLIEEKGLKYSFLIKKLGISYTSLCRKLNGKSEFKASEITTLSEVLGLTNANEIMKIFLIKK